MKPLLDIVGQIFHDFLVLFAMVNAVGNLPVFALLTQGLDTRTRKRIFRKAVLVAASIVISFALFGDVMLRSIFEVDISAFRVAGGILVFAVAARGVLTGPKHEEHASSSYENVAVFPMGFPYLAGPGTILTTILLLQTGGRIVTVGAALLVYASVLPLMHFAPMVERAVGRVGVLVVTRILYIFIAAKAVAFMVDGIRALILPP